MSDIPADHKSTEQVAFVRRSSLGTNEFKEHMFNIKSCIDENKNLKEDCKKLLNAYTTVQADLLKLSSEMKILSSSFLQLNTLEKMNNTLQEKVVQQESLIHEQKKTIQASSKESNKCLEELKKQVLDLKKENLKRTSANEKEYKLILEAEEKRKNAELARVKNEQSRNASEKLRIGNEKTRKNNEELARGLMKSLQDKILESAQINLNLKKDESNRKSAEKIREEHESNRTRKESETVEAVLTSSELLGKKIAEIELKIKNMLKNDGKVNESSAIDKIEISNVIEESKSKPVINEEASNATNNINLLLPEVVKPALPLVKQESGEANKATETHIVVETVVEPNTLQIDNKSIQGCMENDSKDRKNRKTAIDAVVNGSELDIVDKNTQPITKEKKLKRELTVLDDMLNFDQENIDQSNILVESTKSKEDSTIVKVSLVEQKHIEQDQNESIVLPAAELSINSLKKTKFGSEAAVNLNVPDVIEEPGILTSNIKTALANTKESINMPVSTKTPKERVEEPLINPESPALKTNNDVFSGSTSETLVGDEQSKEAFNSEGGKINESDEVIVDMQSGNEKGRPI